MTPPASTADTPAAVLPWWLRAHRALMPDYNRKAALYWWLIVCMGAAALLMTGRSLLALPAADWLQIGAAVAIAMLAGLFPVRIPRSKNSFAAGEIFIFLLLLMHGPAAAALAALGEGAVGAWRTSKRWTSRILTPAMACLSMLLNGSLLYAALDAAKAHRVDGAAVLLLATMACAVLHFMFNTTLATVLPYLKRDRWPTRGELFGNFGWVGITFAGSASVAGLLFLSFQQSGLGVLMAGVPIIAALLSALHYYFQQQEADERARQQQVHAIEREHELKALHVQALEVSERRFHSAFTHASIGMALVSFEGTVLQANAALCALLGVDGDEAITHRGFSDLVAAGDAAALDDHLMQMRSQRIQSFAIELRLRDRAGDPLWAALHGSFFAEIDSAAPCLILQVQDITARRKAEQGLHQIAFHDSLTGLPNRRRFQELLMQALGQTRADTRRHFGLMFIDFDRFKLINDSLGHAVGDEFLAAVSKRIQRQLPPSDVVARLGGDEFAILAEDLDCERYAVALADRLMQALGQPLQIAGHEITTSASIGITFSGLGYATPQEMLRDADTAMYKAKANGKARYALFDAALHTEVSQRLRLEGDLRRALALGQLSVAYQPLFDLPSGRVTGFEALARWNHPQLGMISPATFIAVAEEARLIMPLTDFVLRRACQQLKQWQLLDDRFADLKMQVNVSGSDVAHAGFVARVTSALVEAHLEPQHLALELTENILMQRLEAARPTLVELRRLGIGLSVDDFGTGHSSLLHLSKLPVSSLKIDRAFVADLEQGGDAAAIVQAIVLLGKSLGKAVVAEGIETAGQLARLRQAGCESGQGYLLARPLAPELIEALLEKVRLQGSIALDRRPSATALFH